MQKVHGAQIYELSILPRTLERDMTLLLFWLVPLVAITSALGAAALVMGDTHQTLSVIRFALVVPTHASGTKLWTKA